MRISVLSIIICFVLLSTSCREDERIIPSTPNQVTPGVSGTSVKGFFLLNEGNMGSNKATLDYFDYETGIYHKNIYAERTRESYKNWGMWEMISKSMEISYMPSSTVLIS